MTTPPRQEYRHLAQPRHREEVGATKAERQLATGASRLEDLDGLALPRRSVDDGLPVGSEAGYRQRTSAEGQALIPGRCRSATWRAHPSGGVADGDAGEDEKRHTRAPRQPWPRCDPSGTRLGREGLELESEVVCRVESRLRAFLETLPDQTLEARRDRRVRNRQVGQILTQDRG